MFCVDKVVEVGSVSANTRILTHGDEFFKLEYEVVDKELFFVFFDEYDKLISRVSNPTEELTKPDVCVIFDTIMVGIYPSYLADFIVWIDILTGESGCRNERVYDALLVDDKIYFIKQNVKKIFTWYYRDDILEEKDYPNLKIDTLGDDPRIIYCDDKLFTLDSKWIDEEDDTYDVVYDTDGNALKSIPFRLNWSFDYSTNRENISFFNDGTYFIVQDKTMLLKFDSFIEDATEDAPKDTLVTVDISDLIEEYGEKADIFISSSYKDLFRTILWVRMGEKQNRTFLKLVHCAPSKAKSARNVAKVLN